MARNSGISAAMLPMRVPLRACMDRLRRRGGNLRPFDAQTASVGQSAMRQTSISPMLSVRRGAEAVEFYKSALGADVVYRIDAPDGAVVARLSINGAEFWVADESPEHKNFSPETLGGGTVRMVMIVDDPDSVFVKAVGMSVQLRRMAMLKFDVSE